MPTSAVNAIAAATCTPRKISAKQRTMHDRPRSVARQREGQSRGNSTAVRIAAAAETQATRIATDRMSRSLRHAAERRRKIAQQREREQQRRRTPQRQHERPLRHAKHAGHDGVVPQIQAPGRAIWTPVTTMVAKVSSSAAGDGRQARELGQRLQHQVDADMASLPVRRR